MESVLASAWKLPVLGHTHVKEGEPFNHSYFLSWAIMHFLFSSRLLAGMKKCHFTEAPLSTLLLLKISVSNNEYI